MPKFQDLTTWQQAEQLMQPAFIRLIDNLRKQLEEQTAWSGVYEEVQVWAEGTSEETKTRVLLLRSELEGATPEEATKIEQALAQLPSPYPGYQLCLKCHDQQVTIDLWELCYRICFRDYDVLTGISQIPDQPESQGVVIDTSLFDAVTGEVDWNLLEEKTHQLVEKIFADLPK
jgi:hypothetical protein